MNIKVGNITGLSPVAIGSNIRVGTGHGIFLVMVNKGDIEEFEDVPVFGSTTVADCLAWKRVLEDRQAAIIALAKEYDPVGSSNSLKTMYRYFWAVLEGKTNVLETHPIFFDNTLNHLFTCAVEAKGKLLDLIGSLPMDYYVTAFGTEATYSVIKVSEFSVSEPTVIEG